MKNNIRAILVAGLAKALGVPVNIGQPIGLPDNLFLVRHGESEGNVAVHLSKHGDNSAFNEDFLDRHSKTWKLTDKGIEQAKQAGQWLIANDHATFDHYYVSSYDRAKMTAAYLGLPDARWHRPKVNLRERDRGRLDVTSFQELHDNHPEVIKGEEQEAYLFRFPGGESLADVELRARHMFRTLEREAPGQNAIIVSHGEVMWCLRMLLEGFSLSEFMALNSSRSDFDRIHNCQILHYSRIDHVTGEKRGYYVSKRSICPWDMTKSSNIWTHVTREKYTNDALLATVTA